MAPPVKQDEFRVVCAGLTYRPPGSEMPTAFALHGQHIALDAGEAERLRALGSIVGKGEESPVVQFPPELTASRALESNAENAAKAKTAAKK